MRVWLTLLIVISGSGMTSCSNSYGITMLRVPEEELNRGLTHVINTHLIPYLEDDFEFEDLEYKMGETSTFYINQIEIETLDSLTTSVQLKAANLVELSARLEAFIFSCNFTIVTSDVDRYPDVEISILKPSLALTVEIGTGATGNDASLKECHADFGTFDSDNDDVKQYLLGFMEVGGKGTLAKLVEEICPIIEEEAKTVLVDILKIEETFTINDAGNKKLDVNIKVHFTETSQDMATIITSVTKTGSTHPTLPRRNVRFPGGSGGKVELWMDSDMLKLLSDDAITEKVFSDTTYSFTHGNDDYSVFVNPKIDDYDVVLTADGVIMKTVAKVTLDHIGQDQNPCITIDLYLDAYAPVIITYSDRTIIISPDLNRLKVNYNITRLAGKCDTPNADLQELLLRAYDEHFQNSLKDEYIDIEVVKTKYFGFRDIAVETHMDAVVIECLLELNVDATPSATNHTLYHKTARGKLVTAKLRDGRTRTIESRKEDGNVNTAADIRRADITTVAVLVLSVMLVSLL